jgi:hypothetical protein
MMGYMDERFDPDAELRSLLETLDPMVRDDLRKVLVRDQADRDAISSRLMRYRDQAGDDWADIIDFLRCARMPGGESSGFWASCQRRARGATCRAGGRS